MLGRGHWAMLSLCWVAGTGCSEDPGPLARLPGSGGRSGAVATGGSSSRHDASPDAALDSYRGGASGGITAGFGGATTHGGAIGRGGAADSTIGRGGSATGGMAGGGGASRDANVLPSGGAGGAADSGGATCAFDIAAELGPKIATVGIVTWTSSLAKLTSAHIDFGLTTAYGMTAPVDLQAPSYRTLLLGLKTERTYHYRIVASDGTDECASEDRTLTTGKLQSWMTKTTLSTRSTAAPLAGGFLLAGPFVMHEATKTPGYVWDADGDLVWSYSVPMPQIASMRMDYAGTHMWFSNTGGPGLRTYVVRTTMDGAVEDDLSSALAGQHHRLTFPPDDTVIFIAYDGNGCDDIKEYGPDGKVRTVVNAGAAQGLEGECEVVDVQYSREDDALVFSDRVNRSLVKVRRKDGATLWVLGGSKATLSGDPWPGPPSGIHVLGVDRVLFFDADTEDITVRGSGNGGSAIEMSINVTNKTATRIWSYRANPSIDVPFFGDVQRMPGGNTFVSYSIMGVFHEVDAAGTLLQEWSGSVGSSYGYAEKRASLYGLPPR